MGERTAFCPDDEAIAAFFDQRLPGNERDSVSRHLSDCRYCRGRLGMLSRLENADQEYPVSEEYKAQATQLAGARGRNPWRLAPAWAAAAAVVFAIGIWIGQIQSPTLTSNAPDTRELRSVDPAALEPSILRPAENALIDPAAFEVQWTPVAGSLHYELFVLSDAGDLLVHERLDGTSWAATAPLPLEPAGEYYVRVEAHLEDATTVSTDHVLFMVAGEK